ncbi:hypothetical protein DD237_003517 [Peronospora effusa]|uniref:Uncharacterized protein n=1 Tax=Peronospora effusa TaxID=542832 RepID=A0A425CF23_9STRA|nr:hypothetical protein DD237_003517 [Peronospora effusa]
MYLSQYGGEEYMLNAPRDNLMNQNREGILSLAGYTSLYMLSIYAGQNIFGYIDTNGAKAQRNMRWLVATLLALTVMLWLSTYLSVRLVARPSRRMANLMTGAVNLSMHTINASPVIASTVLLFYMLAICVLASVLQQAHIRIKL